jgi:CDP-paratose 2-epimerase
MFKSIVITGGAGFVGSSLAIFLKEWNPDFQIYCFDNLRRRGSELNIPRLKASDISFIHGDIRNKSDLEDIPDFDLLIDCSAEPSVLAGITSSPSYLIETNLIGTLNCLEIIRKNHASIIFLSTSRVYPIKRINEVEFKESESRFAPVITDQCIGISEQGISESFPLDGVRSLYGSTKLSSELFIQEYADSYGIPSIINRCGLISGPWQMGKVDQGVIMHWVLSHLLGRPLQYIGYGGEGKQVRDVLHISDLCRLIQIQISQFNLFDRGVYNAGGGLSLSISLKELTLICQEVTGKKVPIEKITQNRHNDLKWYITDNSKITSICNWKPEKTVEQTVSDIAGWINSHRQALIHVI